MELNLKLLLVVIPFLLLVSFTTIHDNSAFGQTDNSTTYNVPQEQSNSDVLIINSNTKEAGQNNEIVRLPISNLLFDVTPNYDQHGIMVSLSIKLKSELNDLYQTIGLFNKPRDIVFIYPSFTQAAYSNNGFYDYYHKTCDASCLTVPIPTKVVGFQSSSIAGAFVLKLLNYPYVKDEDVDKNPDILKQYKRVIVLHNEYVTKREFNAITSHPDVIYLYPNALYAEVQTNYNTNTITLIKGHGYPDPSLRNGFNWADDNSRYEYNIECNNWNFYKKDNATMLNCYPEYKMLYAPELLRQLQRPDPAGLVDEITEWLRYPDQKDATSNMLNDFEIAGTHIPPWVSKPAIWSINGEITKSEFGSILKYLYDSHIIK
jgi:hypothetical protein